MSSNLLLLSGILFSTFLVPAVQAQQTPAPPTKTIKTAATHTAEEQKVLNVSKMKWD